MAITQIAIDTGILQSDITAMEAALVAVQNKTESMFNNMAALDSMWEGIANQAFMQQFNKDYVSMKELCELLASLIENIKTAKKEYEQCESNVSTVIKDIQIEAI